MRGIRLLQLVKKPQTPNGDGPASDAQEQAESAVSAASPETAGEVWQSVELPRNYARARAGLMLAIAIPLLVLAVLGIKSVFASNSSVAASPAEEQAAQVDTTAASSTAEYVARNWITLDEPAKRSGRLARVWEGADNPNWDGEGSLELKGSAYTAATEIINDKSVDVTVAVYVSHGDDNAGWIGVLVPIQLDEGAASVRAEPKIVGLPDPAPLQPGGAQETDRALADSTQSDIERFFAAWADGDADGITAPGTDIPTPPASLGNVEVTSWDVTAGTGDTRHGTAQIQYKIGKATITSTYDVDITRVTSSTGQNRWQVSSITSTN